MRVYGNPHVDLLYIFVCKNIFQFHISLTLLVPGVYKLLNDMFLLDYKILFL